MDLCRTHEASEVHMTQYNNLAQTSSVSAIKSQDTCSNCGGSHPRRPRERCPAYGSSCRGCGKLHHWQSVCLSSNRNRGRTHTDKSRPQNNQQDRGRGRGQYRQRSRSRSRRRPGWQGQQRNDGRSSGVHCVQQEEPGDYEPASSFEQLSFKSICKSVFGPPVNLFRGTNSLEILIFWNKITSDDGL